MKHITNFDPADHALYSASIERYEREFNRIEAEAETDANAGGHV